EPVGRHAREALAALAVVQQARRVPVSPHPAVAVRPRHAPAEPRHAQALQLERPRQRAGQTLGVGPRHRQQPTHLDAPWSPVRSTTRHTRSPAVPLLRNVLTLLTHSTSGPEKETRVMAVVQGVSPWAEVFAARTRQEESDALAAILALANARDVISFSGGFP